MRINKTAIARAKAEAEAEIAEAIASNVYPQEVLAYMRYEMDGLEQASRLRMMHSTYAPAKKKGVRRISRFDEYKGISGVDLEAKYEVYKEASEKLEDELMELDQPLGVDEIYQLKGYPKGMGAELRDINEAKQGKVSVGMGLLKHVNEMRSNKSKGQDSNKLAGDILPPGKYHLWLRRPNKYDIVGVDTPTHATKKKQGKKKRKASTMPRMSSIKKGR